MALGILALFAGRAQAFEKAGSLDGVDYRFICADWTLLKEKINALVILSRPPGAPGGKKTVRLELDFPTDVFKAAAGPAGMRTSLGIEPGETKRFAFKGLLALDEAAPGRHPFELRISAGEGAPEVSPFEVVTVRGAVPPRGILSILYPAIVSLLFLPFFIFFLLRLGEPGGWRTVKDAELAEAEEAWWEEEESP